MPIISYIGSGSATNSTSNRGDQKSGFRYLSKRKSGKTTFIKNKSIN